MNPSSGGWIHKFINEFTNDLLVENFSSSQILYEHLKKTGFIYGISLKPIINQPVSELRLTKEEFTKINLFHSLWYSFFSKNPNGNANEAIDSIISFYNSIEKGRQSFFQKLQFSSNSSENLEKILAARLQESNVFLKKESISLLSYAFLYLDVLAYTHFLYNTKDVINYIETIEKIIVDTSHNALLSKKTKSTYDNLIIDILSSSYGDQTNLGFNELTVLEKKYILDTSCLALWDDNEFTNSELDFLMNLSSQLQLKEKDFENSVNSLIEFTQVNSHRIQLFEYSYPAKQIYKQSTQTIKLLILRNKTRLLKELNQSSELLLLISQSAVRDLSAKEKAKMKEQLLDIFKTIPSLAIFLLPGGAILLPLFVKLIPKLLPSAFNENRIKKK